MARNLLAKLPRSDTLRVYDINTESAQKFADETKALSQGATVEVAASVRDAAENSVSFSSHTITHLPSFRLLSDEFVLSMI